MESRKRSQQKRENGLSFPVTLTVHSILILITLAVRNHKLFKKCIESFWNKKRKKYNQWSIVLKKFQIVRKEFGYRFENRSKSTPFPLPFWFNLCFSKLVLLFFLFSFMIQNVLFWRVNLYFICKCVFWSKVKISWWWRQWLIIENFNCRYFCELFATFYKL